MQVLSSGLSKLSNLTELYLRFCGNLIDQNCSWHLANCINKLDKLEVLSFSLIGCRIGDEEINSLSISISRLQNL